MTDLAPLRRQCEQLIEKWRASHAHTYASENADLYRGFDNGCARCADDLEPLLALVDEQAQRLTELKALARGLREEADGNARDCLKAEATIQEAHDLVSRAGQAANHDFAGCLIDGILNLQEGLALAGNERDEARASLRAQEPQQDEVQNEKASAESEEMTPGRRALTPPPLASCPFCGGQARLQRGTTPSQWPTTFVACTECGGRTKSIMSAYWWVEVAPLVRTTTDALLAARAWNVRPGCGTSACPQCGVAVPHTHRERASSPEGYDVILQPNATHEAEVVRLSGGREEEK